MMSCILFEGNDLYDLLKEKFDEYLSVYGNSCTRFRIHKPCTSINEIIDSKTVSVYTKPTFKYFLSSLRGVAIQQSRQYRVLSLGFVGN
jgi:hypothetical protein